MLTINDYYLLVLKAFESLERDIKECKEYTINQYNENIKKEEEKEVAEQSNAKIAANEEDK